MLSFSHRQLTIAFRAIGMAFFFVVLLPRLIAQNPYATVQDPPDTEHLRPAPRPDCFHGPLLHIPSTSAGSEGLLVRISPPEVARYPKGAPIAVNMIAEGSSVRGADACLSEQGFIDVGFLCPGGQYRDPDGTVWKSGGSISAPSPAAAQACAEALADVLSFATGKKRSLDGKSIQNYTGRVTALTGNAGIVAWSFGGNLAILAMGRHGERFPGLRWYASWESPVVNSGDDGRGSILEANPFYNSNDDKVDFNRLRYSPTMPIWVFPLQGLKRQPNWPHGGLYLDGDGDGVFDRNHDYGFWVGVDPGPPLKAFYSPRVTKEAAARKVFGDQWPAHIATQQEVEDRASRDDTLRDIPNVVIKLPGLAVLIFESEKHHVAAGDHSNAILQINAWLDAHARWVRFNPDINYVESIMAKKPSHPIQNPAGRKINRETVRDLVEPEAEHGGPTDKQGMTAVACELADRNYRKNWTPVLNRILVQRKTAGTLTR